MEEFPVRVSPPRILKMKRSLAVPFSVRLSDPQRLMLPLRLMTLLPPLPLIVVAVESDENIRVADILANAFDALIASLTACWRFVVTIPPVTFPGPETVAVGSL